MDLLPGTQIVYVPEHAEGDEAHPDCERGFVTSLSDDGSFAWCRYWSQAEPGELRTKANSKATLLDFLVVRDTVAQVKVDALIGELYRLGGPLNL